MGQNITGQGNIGNQSGTDDVQRRDDVQFQAEVDSLIKEAEETRLHQMKKHRSRNFLTVILGLISIMLGAGGFGWFFLMQYSIAPAVLCMAAGICLPILMHFWSGGPLKAYKKNHKTDFMPRMAKAMGGLKFYSSRGISTKILPHTGITPAYEHYEAEDCFMGIYKGVKVIFSEARLFEKGKKGEPVFNGIFVLLEVPEGLIEGHTIVTSDKAMVNRNAQTRWQKFQPVPVKTGDPEIDRFQVFSDTPEAASLLVGKKLLKELAEASGIFGNAPLSAALFRGKYIFLTISCEEDMFEASNIHVPVTTRQHALNCKKEIERIMEIIDVFELYRPGTVDIPPAGQPV